MRKMYSPAQVAIGTFLGGPFAAAYFLSQNFRSMLQPAMAKKALLYGGIPTVAYIMAIPFLPEVTESIPDLAFIAVYLAITMQVVHKHQMKKDAIEASADFGFRSNWSVVGVSVGALLVFMAAAGVWLLLMIALGFVKV